MLAARFSPDPPIGPGVTAQASDLWRTRRCAPVLSGDDPSESALNQRFMKSTIALATTRFSGHVVAARQVTSKMLRCCVSAATKRSAHGQRAGMCKVTRRAERVSRPGRLR